MFLIFVKAFGGFPLLVIRETQTVFIESPPTKKIELFLSNIFYLVSADGHRSTSLLHYAPGSPVFKLINFIRLSYHKISNMPKKNK